MLRISFTKLTTYLIKCGESRDRQVLNAIGAVRNGGLILVCELDERLGLSELMQHHLRDFRRGKNAQLPLPDLLRQSIYSHFAVTSMSFMDRSSATLWTG